MVINPHRAVAIIKATVRTPSYCGECAESTRDDMQSRKEMCTN